MSAQVIEDLLVNVPAHVQTALPEESGDGTHYGDDLVLAGLYQHILDLGIDILKEDGH